MSADDTSQLALPEAFRRIAFFALSNAAEPSAVERGLANLRALGAMPAMPPSCPGNYRHFAGSDEWRAAQFNAVVAQGSCDLLMALRGGYGVTRVLERIDFGALRSSGATLCGYSDVSALLLAAAAHGCTRLLHGPMLTSSCSQEMTSEAFQREMASFVAVLQGTRTLLPAWQEARVLTHGTAEGTLFATNLTLLDSLVGTKYLPDFHGAILALEDVHETAHSIDRRLNHLRQAGILPALHGLLFGQFSKGEDAEFLPEIFAEYAAGIHGPVVENIPLGHQHPSITLPVNVRVRLATEPIALVVRDS